MNILVIDDDDLIFELIKKQASRHWPSASVDFYNPRVNGLPGDDFDWSKYKIILLDYDFGSTDFSGLDILNKLSEIENYPIVILITAKGNEKIAVSAIQMGADDYLIKNDILTDRFKNIIDDSILIATSQSNNSVTATAVNFPGIITIPVTSISIPGYEVLKKISRNKSQVFLARSLKDDNMVAIKVHRFSDTDPIMTLRFKQEVQILSSLDHRNIIKVLDSGNTENLNFYVMKYYNNGEFGNRLKQGAIPVSTAKNIINQILDAVNILHANHIIHRDLKSNNIFIGDNEEPIIADFNSAILTNSVIKNTNQNNVIGTPHYMSPEQINGREIDQRTDIYSLGVLFYEILAGKKPFTGQNVMEIIFKHTYSEPDLLPEDVNQFQSIISKMLEKNKMQRYSHIGDIIRDIENI